MSALSRVEAPRGHARVKGCRMPVLCFWDVLRVFLACLLLGAAGLKVQHAMVAERFAETSIFTSHLSIVGLTTGEVLLSGWLLSNVYPSLARLVATGVFFVFAQYSLLQATQGARSCSCFGRVTVSPWVTFVLDSLIVLCLVGARDIPVEQRPRGRQWRVAMIFVGAVVWIVGVAAAHFWWPARNSDIEELGVWVGEKRVFLQPERWVGRPFPLLPYLLWGGDNLQRGRWLVVLMNPECGRCWGELGAYGERAQKEGVRLAVVWLADWRKTSGFRAKDKSNMVWTTLRPEVRWMASTPMGFYLQEGKVEELIEEEKGVAEGDKVCLGS